MLGAMQNHADGEAAATQGVAVGLATILGPQVRVLPLQPNVPQRSVTSHPIALPRQPSTMSTLSIAAAHTRRRPSFLSGVRSDRDHARKCVALAVVGVRWRL